MGIKTFALLAFCCFLFKIGLCDYTVCSGYVNTLTEVQNRQFDLSKIKISIYYDGILKDTTTCNPDGSYMLSIDEKNKKPFTLIPEGPTKATFDPPYKIIDPTKNMTLCKTNIIFVFLGFTISGQVLSKYSTVGPQDFPVELALSDNSIIQKAKTEQNGHFKFEHVYPGDYIVRAAKTTEFTVDPHANSLSCKLDWSSSDSCSKSKITVLGYYLKGNLENALSGVILAIYTRSEAVAKEIRTSEAEKLSAKLPTFPGFHLIDAKQISVTVFFHIYNAKKGNFEVSGIPAGDYKIAPVLLQNPRHLAIEPQSQEIFVKHANATLTLPFKVIEFSIKGHVLSPKKTGIEGVKIKVDAKERAVSNAKGEYWLDKVFF